VCGLISSYTSNPVKKNANKSETYQHKMVGRAGFEPATNWLKEACPNSNKQLFSLAIFSLIF
jgi:hypothetical protein